MSLPRDKRKRVKCSWCGVLVENTEFARQHHFDSEHDTYDPTPEEWEEMQKQEDEAYEYYSRRDDA